MSVLIFVPVLTARIDWTYGQVQGPKGDSKPKGGVEDTRIVLGGSQYVTVGVLIGAIASLLTIGYTVVKYLEIQPLKREREDLKSQLTNAQADLQASRTRFEE